MKTKEQQWKIFYKIGGISVFLALLTMLTEIFLTALPDGAPELRSIADLYEMYNRNWFMAMRYMGLINIVGICFLIPVFFALFGLHQEKMPVFSGFALLLIVLSYAIFFADNASFAFLELAKKYSIADETEKIALISAGEALFAKGASHTPGTFPGFIIGQIATICFSVIILKSLLLKKIVGIIGIIAYSFLAVFEITSSFISSIDTAMIFAMIGGILSLIWFALVGTALLNKSK